MCELLGMSANVPTDICFSFKGLMQRGGGTGPHRDGFGVCFYQGRGLRSFHDPAPSCESDIARLICDYPIKSNIVLGHIRQANVGNVCLANTHPFSRELWGRAFCCAHNGQLDPAIFDLPLARFQPIGSTDSEYAFCWLLGELERLLTAASGTGAIADAVQDGCDLIAGYGVFNLLLSDSQRLYCYCGSKLQWLTRRAPFGNAELCDADVRIDFCQETTPTDVVSVIATEPLTGNECWTEMQPGTLIVFVDGKRVEHTA